MRYALQLPDARVASMSPGRVLNSLAYSVKFLCSVGSNIRYKRVIFRFTQFGTVQRATLLIAPCNGVDPPQQIAQDRIFL
jgi:hypothetical protein